MTQEPTDCGKAHFLPVGQKRCSEMPYGVEAVILHPCLSADFFHQTKSLGVTISGLRVDKNQSRVGTLVSKALEHIVEKLTHGQHIPPPGAILDLAGPQSDGFLLEVDIMPP